MPLSRIVRSCWPLAGPAVVAGWLSMATPCRAADGNTVSGGRTTLGFDDQSTSQTPPTTRQPAANNTAPPTKATSTRVASADSTDDKKDKTPDSPSVADPDKDEEKKPRQPWYSVHGQGTVITQVHDNFPSPYIGPRSLLPDEPAATTETATLFLAVRMWEGADLVFNPEISGGRGFSGVNGIAGFPNGEATRVGSPEPTPYIARLYVRQTWGFDGEHERVEDATNQIAGVQDVDRITLSVGRFAATDFIDNNAYSHDPRSQFENWSIMDNGAWDYPANTRGYTYGLVFELNTMFWALHYGIFAEPREANGEAFDPKIDDANGQVLELVENYNLDGCPGKIHEFVYLNHAHMGNYALALQQMPVNPDVTLTRAYRFKYGFGLGWEQEVAKDLGLFARLGWNDGHSESWAFTPIDRTAVLGLLWHGRLWRRPKDAVGLAGVINGLAKIHRDYLAAGGLDFNIGDGRLNYAPEQIIELYYDCQLPHGISVTADFQGANHPAYNADRGPVAIAALRVHFEY